MHPTFTRAAICTAAFTCALSAQSATFSDTSIAYRYGTEFAEPFNNSAISKDILTLNHVSGFKYGSNFFNVDMLMSDNKDPASAGSGNGAQEVYIVFRNTLDLEKISGSPYKFGPVRGVGITTGFDYNTKTDAGYNSKKRMVVAGPTLMMDVPGFLNISLLAMWESNAPYSTFSGVSTPRYSYDTHAMLGAVWGIPLGSGFSFEGFANFIAAKGKNEFGGDTAAETLIDMQVMYDLSSAVGTTPNSFRVGIEYQYWKNKFGNDSDGPAGRGAFAKTPMVRLEYHF